MGLSKVDAEAGAEAVWVDLKPTTFQYKSITCDKFDSVNASDLCDWASSI